jgi:hypothetical protein
MRELEIGDSLRINGETVTIRGFWGQGVHKMFRLEDDRIMPDLHKAVANGHAELMSKAEVKQEARDNRPEFQPGTGDKTIPTLDRKKRFYGEDLED